MFHRKIIVRPSNFRIALSLTAALAVGVVCFLLPAPTMALSNEGPDKADLGVHGTGSPGDDFSYVVSSSNYGSVAIPSTTVLIYYPDNSGNKTITITDGDICSDTLESAPAAGNQRDRFGSGTQGTSATDFVVQNMGQTQKVAAVTSIVSDADDCYRATRTMTFSGSLLEYDPDAALWKAKFTATINNSLSAAQNRFSITLAPDAIVGYSAADVPQSFGLARDYPYSGYRDYALPFAPDCSLTSPATKSITLYDLDNSLSSPEQGATPGNSDGKQITSYLDDYNASGGYIGRVPLTITGAPFTALPNDAYIIDGPSRALVTIKFTMEPGHRYKFAMDQVYYINVLQFKLPYDSVYYKSLKCGPPVTLTCGTMSVSPANPEPNTQVQVTTNVGVSGGTTPPPGSSGTIKVDTANGFHYTDPSPQPIATPGNLKLISDSFQVTQPDTYTVTWTASISGQNITCLGDFSPGRSFYVLQRPYFEVNGGDVVAGASFATPVNKPCGLHNDGAGIAGWNKAVSPYAGAGGQYAAMAMSRIQEFATDQDNPSGASVPTTLSFSNIDDGGSVSNPPTGGMFGGMFGNVVSCVDYWYTKKDDSQLQPITTNSITLNGYDGDYLFDGDVTGSNLTINASQIGVGKHVTIYVNHASVAITGNISYDAGWPTTSDIPSLKIINHGSIYIDHGVTQLDGQYVAVPDSNYTGPRATPNSFTAVQPGTISTCSSGFGIYNPKQTAAFFSDCGQKLTVNGSLAANQIWLLRTRGTMSGTPAEVINYGPEVWLAPDSGNQFDPSYQSIVGLPPIL